MSINGFDFPKVTLRQVFQSTGAGTVDELGVVCVGPVYQYSPGETALPALFNAGVSGKYSSSLPASEQLEATTADVDTADAHAYVQNGVWQYAVDDAADWVDSSDSGSAPDTLVLGTLVHDGTELAEGDSVALYTTETAFELYTVSSIASNTATHTYSVQVSGSTALPTSIVKVGFCLTADAEVHLNAVGVAVSDTTPAHTQSISATKSDFTTKYAGHSSLTLLKAEANSIKIRYRVVNKEFVRTYGSVDSLGDVETTLGPVCANNPVALGCYFALAGGAGTVYFIGTANGARTRAAFLNALDYLDRYTNMYSVVPCLPDNDTKTADVIQACAGAIQQTSEDVESKVWRTLWYGISLTENESNGAAGTKVQTLIGKRRTNSHRAQCVWGDGLRLDGEDLAGCNFALAAAAAGMRAGQPCHRPLSNLSYSFFSLTEPNAFTMSNLKALGANGIWIIANNEDGAPTNLRQVTTAVANNLNEDEESIVANADNIAINMAQVGREIVGCSNISPDLLLALEATIRNRMDAKLVNSYGAYIGPQILAWELVRPPYQDPVNLDHVLADFSITPPRPFNQFHMTLVVL